MCFYAEKCRFLGYKISAAGVATHSGKIDAVQSCPIPRKLKEVRGFLGLCGYYRRFVDRFSDIAAPLHALTKKNRTFQWTLECQQAFDTLKQRLTEAPVLSLPRDDGQYVIDTDASDHGIGAVLSQVQNGEERVISYASRLYSDAEKRYCVTRKELLAVVFFLKHFRQYLLGRPFLVRTDHAALQWLRKTPEPIGQQSRWLETLEEFTFTVEHRPGVKHANADAMSRRPCRQCGQCGSDDVVPTCASLRAVGITELTPEPSEDWTPEAISRGQCDDPDLAPLYRAKRDGLERPEWSSMLQASQSAKIYWTMWPFLEMDGSILYLNRVGSHDKPARRLVASPCYRPEIMRQAHAGFTGGHLGERRTVEQVRRRAY